MQQRLLGATGLSVSRLGLGTMTWGRDTDEHEAREQLAAFVEAGGTLVDTAAGYTDGDSERLIGSLHRRRRARATTLVLATKAGVGRRKGERFTNASRGHLLSSLDASLRRLGVDHVDLWQVHTWVDDAPLEETLSALDYAVTSGRAAYVGVSNYNGWQSAQAATWQRAVPGPGAAGVQPGRVLPAQPRRRGARSIPAAQALGLGVLPVVAARPRRAHRQVPRRHPRRLPRAPRRTSPPSSAATSTTSSQRVVEAVARAADGLGLVPRSRWRSPGCATGPASPRRSSAPAPPPSCASR